MIKKIALLLCLQLSFTSAHASKLLNAYTPNARIATAMALLGTNAVGLHLVKAKIKSLETELSAVKRTALTNEEIAHIKQQIKRLKKLKTSLSYALVPTIGLTVGLTYYHKLHPKVKLLQLATQYRRTAANARAYAEARANAADTFSEEKRVQTSQELATLKFEKPASDDEVKFNTVADRLQAYYSAPTRQQTLELLIPQKIKGDSQDKKVKNTLRIYHADKLQMADAQRAAKVAEFNALINTLAKAETEPTDDIKIETDDGGL